MRYKLECCGVTVDHANSSRVKKGGFVQVQWDTCPFCFEKAPTVGELEYVNNVTREYDHASSYSTDAQLMEELERRFMDINNLEGNKIWAWMNNYSCGDAVMSMCGKRGRLIKKLKEERRSE